MCHFQPSSSFPFPPITPFPPDPAPLQTHRDTAGATILTGTGDALPSQVDSKRLHSVPGGVTHDPTAKGSTRYTSHIRQTHEQNAGASEGPGVDEVPGEEEMSREEGMNAVERKVES